MKIQRYFAKRYPNNYYFGEIEIQTDEQATYVLEFHASNCRIYNGKFFNQISTIPSTNDVREMEFKLSIYRTHFTRNKIQELESSMREAVTHGV